MYKLILKVDLDGDFIWQSKYLSCDGDNLELISSNRDSLVNIVIDFYTDLQQNLGGEFNIPEDMFKIKYQDTFNEFKEYFIILPAS